MTFNPDLPYITRAGEVVSHLARLLIPKSTGEVFVGFVEDTACWYFWFEDGSYRKGETCQSDLVNMPQNSMLGVYVETLVESLPKGLGAVFHVEHDTAWLELVYPVGVPVSMNRRLSIQEQVGEARARIRRFDEAAMDGEDD